MAPCEWVIDIIKEWVLEWLTPVHVSGTLDPDATCLYFKSGIYNDKTYYVRQDGAWFIWWNGVNLWFLSKDLGVEEKPLWTRNDPSVLGNYIPAAPTIGVATVASGYGCPHLCFVDRGDPAAVDFAYGDLTHDNVWRDLDLSGIVPAGAKAVSIFHEQTAGAILKHVYFRRKGNVNDKNVSKTFQQVAGLFKGKDNTVPLDEDRFIQYNSNIPLFSTCNFTVKGWWL